MADSNHIQNVVERLVAEAINQQLPAIRSQIVSHVGQQIEPVLGQAQATSLTELLNAALAAIQAGTSQVEILDAMVNAAVGFCSRAAVFVLRGQQAHGWRAQGFADNDGIRETALVLSSPLLSSVISDRRSAVGPAGNFDADFITRFAAPANQQVVLFPLVVREKVAGILYADAGVNGQPKLDRAGLEAIVRATGMWLEVLTARRASPGIATSSVQEAMPAEAFMTAVASAASPAAFGQAATAPAASFSPEEQEVHKKAQRFAKLLVDEIKLYNQAKVNEGRQHRDLYDRLKEPIEKSRESYQKRFGGTPAASVDYFSQELIRILANNDPSLLGSGFSR